MPGGSWSLAKRAQRYAHGWHEDTAFSVFTLLSRAAYRCVSGAGRHNVRSALSNWGPYEPEQHSSGRCLFPRQRYRLAGQCRVVRGTFAAPTSCSVTIANVVKYTFSSFSVVSASGTGGGATYQAGDIAIDVATGGGNTGLLTLSKASADRRRVSFFRQRRKLFQHHIYLQRHHQSRWAPPGRVWLPFVVNRCNAEPRQRLRYRAIHRPRRTELRARHTQRQHSGWRFPQSTSDVAGGPDHDSVATLATPIGTTTNLFNAGHGAGPRR